MLDNFDPKEKKAIIVFFTVLFVAVAYVFSNDLPWDQNRLPENELSEEWKDSQEKPPPQKSYDRFL